MTATQESTKRRPPWPLELYRSDVGRKWVMALSGIAILLFVFVHMAGNLHLYESPERFNEYAEGLRDVGEPLLPRTFILWFARLGLIGAFAIHIHAGFTLWWKNRHARPIGYEADREWVTASFASRYMLVTGVIILVFVGYHLAQLTWGWSIFHPDFVHGDARGNLINALENPAVAGVYIVANLAVGLHILHGAWSMFQSLGLTNPRFNQWRRNFALAFAALVVVGNLSFPLLITTGLVT
jgi:succinate dehydrogenase / fumarate reductase cytochrome b subunit